MTLSETGIRILLVEDDEDHIVLARKVFERHGVGGQVHLSRDGADALDFVFGRGAHVGQKALETLKLILLDLNIPKVPGLEVIRQLKSDPHAVAVPIVVVSVSRDEPSLLQSFNLGIRDYIIKPMEYERFASLYRAHAGS